MKACSFTLNLLTERTVRQLPSCFQYPTRAAAGLHTDPATSRRDLKVARCHVESLFAVDRDVFLGCSGSRLVLKDVSWNLFLNVEDQEAFSDLAPDIKYGARAMNA